MEENLVGHLLHALDPEGRRQVENYVRASPEAQQRLELLRQALEPLGADRDDEEPPSGLALRTLARVAEHRCGELPRAPDVIALHEAAPQRRWWRRADVLVAAVLLLALSGLFWPIVSGIRSQSQRDACANNLLAFHQALVAYSDVHHGAFPQVQEQPRRNVAGVFVPMLHDGGFLAADVSVRCPGNGERLTPRWSLEELQDMSEEEFNHWAPKLAGCYAYSLGYRDADGNLHGIRRGGGDLHPILADRPAAADTAKQIGRDNSPNHGGGQNILFVGGHVEFRRDHTINGDDIFVNRNHRVAAGLDEWDYVLGASDDRP